MFLGLYLLLKSFVVGFCDKDFIRGVLFGKGAYGGWLNGFVNIY